MYEVYKNVLNKYKTANYTQNAPLMLFSSVGLPSKYGSWGLLDYMDQVAETPTHPKFQAVIDFNKGIWFYNKIIFKLNWNIKKLFTQKIKEVNKKS